MMVSFWLVREIKPNTHQCEGAALDDWIRAKQNPSVPIHVGVKKIGIRAAILHTVGPPDRAGWMRDGFIRCGCLCCHLLSVVAVSIRFTRGCLGNISGDVAKMREYLLQPLTFDTSFGMDNQKFPTRSAMFAANVSRFMDARRLLTGENIRQFAERLAVPYEWLRRISTAGVKQESKRTLPHLKKLADELGFSDYRQLWENIPEHLNPDDVMTALQEHHFPQWCLLVAAQAGDVREASQVAGEFLEDNPDVRDTMTVRDAAAFLARAVSESYHVVRRE